MGAAPGGSSIKWATGGSRRWEPWSSIRLEQQQVCNRWESWQQVGAAAGDSSNGWATGGWAKGGSMRWEQQLVANRWEQEVGAAI